MQKSNIQPSDLMQFLDYTPSDLMQILSFQPSDLMHYLFKNNDFKPSVAYKFIDGNVGGAGVKLSIPHYMIMFL